MTVTGYHVTPVVGWWHDPSEVHAKSRHEVDRVARVRLDDLVAYQAARRMHRRSALDAMQTQSAEDGLYEATDGTPPLRR